MIRHYGNVVFFHIMHVFKRFGYDICKNALSLESIVCVKRNK